MPYAFQTHKTKLPPGTDRRVKLTPKQRKEIRENADGLSQRKLAKRYGVSRRLITFILDPGKLSQNKDAREKRGGWEQYYKGGDEWAKTQREHRRYKQTVLKDQPKQTKGAIAMEEHDENEHCRECGDTYPQGGDGWDGLCPDCADKAEAKEDE